MSFLHIASGRYPLSAADIVALHPDLSFPVPFALPDGYAPVQEVIAPTVDALTHQVHRLAPEWVGGAWHERWAVEPWSPDEAEARLEAERLRLAAAATAHRFAVETGGIVLPDGARIDTARADQDAITRVLVNAGAAGVGSISFKAASGWLTLDIEQLRAIASTVALHVQACYEAERAQHAAIALLRSAGELRAYRLDAGWPDSPAEAILSGEAP